MAWTSPAGWKARPGGRIPRRCDGLLKVPARQRPVGLPPTSPVRSNQGLFIFGKTRRRTHGQRRAGDVLKGRGGCATRLPPIVRCGGTGTGEGGAAGGRLLAVHLHGIADRRLSLRRSRSPVRPPP